MRTKLILITLLTFLISSCASKKVLVKNCEKLDDTNFVCEEK